LQGRTAGFGQLKAQEGKSGTLFDVSSSYARALLQTSPPHPLLVALGRALRYEVVVGLNGRVWVEADNCRDVVRVILVLQEGEFVAEGEARGWVERRLQELSDQMASTD
jgi:exosome complex component RRP40